MEYNSQKDILIIPEYGRNVQMMIQHAKTIEDPEYRQAFIEKVIRLMHQMNPQNKNIDDYREKLWNHMFRIANFEIDVVPPNGVKPSREDTMKRPERIGYLRPDSRYRHYGNNVHKLIQKALEMPEGPKRDGFVQVIGNYMKLAYRTWNKEHYVSDEVIKQDLDSLTKGKLQLDENKALDTLTNANRKRKQRPNTNNSYKDNSQKNRRKNYRRK
ncbi:MAG: DUF4290 domain-containing protein [Bacteroidota bacterium]